MKRLFFVSVNKDEMAASLGRYCTDTDIASWTRGFMVGLHGGKVPEHAPEPMTEGASVGCSALCRAEDRMRVASESGKRSAEVRKATKGTARPEAPSKHLRSTSEREAEPTPEQSVIGDRLSKEPEPNTPPLPPRGSDVRREVYPDDFNAWWEAYQRKGSKLLAFGQWKKLSAADRTAAMAGTEAYRASLSERKFQLDGERYLKRRKWEDENVPVNGSVDPTAPATSEQAAAIAKRLKLKYHFLKYVPLESIANGVLRVERAALGNRLARDLEAGAQDWSAQDWAETIDGRASSYGGWDLRPLPPAPILTQEQAARLLEII